MRKGAVILISLLVWVGASAQSQKPLYIVNGKEVASLASIPDDDIESIEQLPTDEQTVAKYGERANNGVILVTLRYDTPARFMGEGSFGEYISRHIKWDNSLPVARFVTRYTITTDGKVRLGDELECTDGRLRRKVIKAVKSAPNWVAASKGGTSVESHFVLSVQLPKGKPLAQEPYIILL